MTELNHGTIVSDDHAKDNLVKPAEINSLPSTLASKTNLQALTPTLEKLPLGCIIYDNDDKILFINSVTETLFGFTKEEVLGKDFFGLYSSSNLKEYDQQIKIQIRNGKTATNQIEEFKKKNGDPIITKWHKSPFENENGEFSGTINLVEDVTATIHNERLQSGQRKILEMIASGKSLSEVLHTLVVFIEKESQRVMGSVLILGKDGKTLYNAAAPSLPPDYNALTNGLEVGPLNGSCGSAVYDKKIIIVEDTSKDIHWNKYKDIAEAFGLRACTSIPIYGSDGQVLGTFGFYYKTPTRPNDYEMELINLSSSLAGIAIQKNMTESTLEQTREIYKLITNNINDVIAILDTSGKLQFASPSIYSVLGYKPEILIGSKLIHLLHPHDVNKYDEILKKVNNGEEVPIILRTLHSNGNYRWIEGWGKLVNNENSKYILTVTRDITEKKKSEDALKESERQLNEAQRLTALGSFDYDLKTNTAKWSEEEFRIFGFVPDEVKPSYQLFLSRIIGEDRRVVENAIEKSIINKEPIDLEFRIRQKNGKVIPVYMKAKVIGDRNGKVLKLIGINQDITSQKESKEALRLSEEKFKTAFEHANIGIAILSLDGYFMKSNRALSSFLGYSEDELQQRNIYSVTHPSYIDETKKSFQEMLERHKESYEGEKKYIHKDGHEIWGQLDTSILFDNTNHPLYYICIIQDINERKIHENKQWLLTEDLMRQNEGLYQFSYITSHNLRAPIATILGLLNVLDLNPNDPDKYLIIENLRKAAVNLDNIITDLNSVINYQKGIDEYRQEIVFEDILKVIKKNLETPLKKAGAKIETDFKDAPSVYSILSYVNSILFNLIENAIKFRSPKRPLEIRIESSLSYDYIILSVCDNGLGIDLKTQGDKVFGLYKRFHSHIEGRGLGLHLVKTQVKALGGKIEVESTVDKGSCFKIFFQRNKELS
jgi:PAS domain S-box-containing protein